MTIENNASRQRVVRVPHKIDNWLLERVRDARRKDIDSRAGVTTEINTILLEAYEASQKPTERQA